MASREDAWHSYAAGSEIAHFATFCREHLIQSEDRWEGKPLVLEPWQRRMLAEALACDSDGWPVWRSVVIIAPLQERKDGDARRARSVSIAHERGTTRDPARRSLHKVAGRLFARAMHDAEPSARVDPSSVRIDYADEVT
jgi:hypothetical protein